jgi:putative transposase
MPNHFHLLILVKNEVLPVSKINSNSLGFTLSKTLTKGTTEKTRTFNESIGIMLRNYTRAINKQKGFSGSLFRAKTKAECVNCKKGITPAFITQNGITLINNQTIENQYPQVCFDYIHQNPVKANLVKTETDWEFSSAIDYTNLRAGKLINKEVAKNYINF